MFIKFLRKTRKLHFLYQSCWKLTSVCIYLLFVKFILDINYIKHQAESLKPSTPECFWKNCEVFGIVIKHFPECLIYNIIIIYSQTKTVKMKTGIFSINIKMFHSDQFPWSVLPVCKPTLSFSNIWFHLYHYFFSLATPVPKTVSKISCIKFCIHCNTPS